MKGYKGFGPGLICRGKQYVENTVFEEAEAEICESGIHFCEFPFDVWNHYPPCDENGELNEFAAVEALAETHTNDNRKFCTAKLKIGARINLVNFIQAGVNFILSKQEKRVSGINRRSTKTNSDSRSAATNTGFRSAATNTGDRSAAINTGDCSVATNTGFCSVATNTGFRSAATNTGDRSAAINTGDRSAAINTGDRSVATNTGYRSVAINTGDRSAAINTGDRSVATNTGDRSVAINTGSRSGAMNTGDYSAATVDGKESIAIVTGKDSRAKGALGNWLVLTERDDRWNIVAVKSIKVDGKKIKPNIFYTLKNKKIIEAEKEKSS